MSKYNFNIDINNDTQVLNKSSYDSISQKQSYENNLYYVNLGLPSGILWARYNVGVNINDLDFRNKWYGDHLAWGEIKSKDEYSWDTYMHMLAYKLTKYCCNSDDFIYEFGDYRRVLELEDDAAAQLMSKRVSKYWKMPEKSDYLELIENTTSKWVYNYNDIEKLNGRLYTSNKNGEILFFPATGYAYDTRLYDTTVAGWYWSSTLSNESNKQKNAYSFGVLNDKETMMNDEKFIGMSVRAVIKE